MIATWQLVIEKVVFREMPPEDESQPDAEKKHIFIRAVEAALTAAGQRSDLKEKLRAPEYGNFVDHQRLFDRNANDLAYSPARLWKKSPFIIDVSKYKIFGSAKNQTGEVDRFVKQPFAMEDKQGFRELLGTNRPTIGNAVKQIVTIVRPHLAEEVLASLRRAPLEGNFRKFVNDRLRRGSHATERQRKEQDQMRNAKH